MKKVVLKRERERSVLHHHPWIFSGAIAECDNDIASGEMVEVVSAVGETLGVGWYSDASMIRVRMLRPLVSDISTMVANSIGRRADFFAHGYTNAVRLINAEGDGIPGVIADYYNGFVVCQFTSAGGDANKDAIADAIMRYAPFCRGVSERTDLKDREREGLNVDGWWNLRGEEPPELIEITEGPCKFLVNVRKGHKTGFYLDQRDARRIVGSYANGCEVLNCFSYTGGFGLFARACGASKVTQIDISADAIEMAKKNEQLVPMCGTEMEYVVEDVFDYLRKCRDENRKFDLIILDPPKFASKRTMLPKASRGYKDINLLEMKLLKPNGYLASFSCSAAMTTEYFYRLLSDAAVDANRDLQAIAHTWQAPDHPVALGFNEGEYLKGAILRAM